MRTHKNLLVLYNGRKSFLINFSERFLAGLNFPFFGFSYHCEIALRVMKILSHFFRRVTRFKDEVGGDWRGFIELSPHHEMAERARLNHINKHVMGSRASDNIPSLVGSDSPKIIIHKRLMSERTAFRGCTQYVTVFTTLGLMLSIRLTFKCSLLLPEVEVLQKRWKRFHFSFQIQ